MKRSIVKMLAELADLGWNLEVVDWSTGQVKDKDAFRVVVYRPSNELGIDVNDIEIYPGDDDQFREALQSLLCHCKIYARLSST